MHRIVSGLMLVSNYQEPSRKTHKPTASWVQSLKQIRSNWKITEQPQNYKQQQCWWQYNYFQQLVKCCYVIVPHILDIMSWAVPAVAHGDSCFHWFLTQSEEIYWENTTLHLGSTIIFSRVSWNRGKQLHILKT